MLLQTLCERLRTMCVIRPNLFALGRMVTKARQQARRETYRLVSPLLTEDRKRTLDSLLITDGTTGRTPLVWLRQEATSCRANGILETVEKLRHLRVLCAADIDLEPLNPNLRKSLARLGRAATPQALSRMSTDWRHPALHRLGNLSSESSLERFELLLCLCLARRLEYARELARQSRPKPLWHLGEHVAHQMDRASLQWGFGKLQAHRFGQSRMAISDHELYSRKTSLGELLQKLAPRRFRLFRTYRHGQ